MAISFQHFLKQAKEIAGHATDARFTADELDGDIRNTWAETEEGSEQEERLEELKDALADILDLAEQLEGAIDTLLEEYEGKTEF